MGKRKTLKLANRLMPKRYKFPKNKSKDLLQMLNLLTNMNDYGKDVKDIIEAKKWIQFASEDIQSSKILHENKHYRNSVMFLQQSVEKLVKSCWIAFFSASSSDVQGISHKSPLAFHKMIKEKWVKPLMSLVNYPKRDDLDADMFNFETSIKDKEKQQQIANVSTTEIEQFLNMCKQVEDKLTDEAIVNTIKSLEPNYNKITKNKGIDLNKIKGAAPASAMLALMNLFLISTITYPHIESRYPNSNIEMVYDENTGIVKKSPEIHNMLDKYISELDNFMTRIMEMKNVQPKQ